MKPCKPLLLASLAAVTSLICGVLGGCIFSPAQSHPDPNPRPVYPVPQSPEVVLDNLSSAYANRDSTEYKSLFDSSYVGISENVVLGTVDEFRYADEVMHIAALARKASITSVAFTFGTLLRFPSDDPAHPEWALIPMPGDGVKVQVDDGEDSWQATGTNEYFQFTFKPTTPAPSSPTDTTWQIIRWKETHSGST